MWFNVLRRAFVASALICVAACNNVGVVKNAGPNGLSANLTPPTVPTSVSAAKSGARIIIVNWQASTDTGTGVSGYHVYRNGSALPITSVEAAALSYADAGLSADTDYHYAVSAFDAANPSNESALSANSQTVRTDPAGTGDTLAPSVPQRLIATATSSSSVQLTWSASADEVGGSGLAGYRVFRDGKQVAEPGAAAVTYAEMGLSAGTSYIYTVQSFDNAGNVSANSNLAPVSTPSGGDTVAPSVPQSLTATVQDATSIHLTWAASADNTGGSGLSGYRVFRGVVQVAQVGANVLIFTDTGLNASTTYSYTVRAFDNTGNVSGASKAAAATTPLPAGDTVAPSVPQSLSTAVQSASSIRLTWSASTDNAGGSGLGGYRVFRGGTQVAQVAASATAYTDSGLSSGTTYTYTVRAVDNAGNVSADSNVASAATQLPTDLIAPSVPQNVSAVPQSSTSIQLTWTASTDNVGGSGVAGYRVLRGSTQIGQVAVGTLRFTDTGLSPSTQYSYNVRAYDVAGNVSANSTLVSAITLASGGDTTAPSVPQSLTAAVQSSTSIKLTWLASLDNNGGSGLGGYRVFRSGAQIVQVGAAALTYTDTGLVASTLYSYTVRGVDNAGNVSADSNTATATTQPAPETGMSQRPSNTTCIAPPRPSSGGGAVSLSVQRVFPNLSFGNGNGISAATMAPGDSSRWFVTELDGHIRTFANSNNASSSSMFLDIASRVQVGGELGLFGIAFHPDFPSDPRAFVSYTTYVNGLLQSRISQFRTSDAGLTLDPNSETVLVTVDQPESNHNGGFIAFGPDRLLYFGLGDGGGAGDQHGSIGNGQNTQTLLGKILRIDVAGISGLVNYRIPASNPFSGNSACNMNGTGSANCPEIYAWGIRNPWKGSFDRQTGQLWVGDVGQSNWEEVDRVNLGGNYGWRCREGASVYNSTCGPAQTLLDPVAQFANAGGSSITGGYVYRGSAIAGLAGQYVFADFIRGLFTVDSTATPTVTVTNLTPLSGIYVVGFAEDHSGELFVVDYNGALYKLLGSGGGGTNTIPDKLTDTGCVNSSMPTQPALGLIPYAPNSPFWSDGASKRRWLGLPNGQNIDTSAADGDWAFPAGTVLVKDFSLGNQLIETRLFMRHPDGVWAGYTYEWNAAQTEATRVTAGKDVNVAGQVWHIPSETECMRCHTQAAGFSLGPETAQLNGDLAYPATPAPPFTGKTANQLFTLNSIGLFSPAISAPSASLPVYPNPLGTTGTVAERARSYLQANCSHCHRPGGGTPVNLDLRYSNAMSATNTCGVTPSDPLGLSGAKVIAPGSPDASILYVRISQRGANQMPPISTNVVDSAGAALLRQWISGMNSSCQ